MGVYIAVPRLGRSRQRTPAPTGPAAWHPTQRSAHEHFARRCIRWPRRPQRHDAGVVGAVDAVPAAGAGGGAGTGAAPIAGEDITTPEEHLARARGPRPGGVGDAVPGVS
jgi:hypothetical protein